MAVEWAKSYVSTPSGREGGPEYNWDGESEDEQYIANSRLINHPSIIKSQVDAGIAHLGALVQDEQDRWWQFDGLQWQLVGTDEEASCQEG